jgi:hypothetical protein
MTDDYSETNENKPRKTRKNAKGHGSYGQSFSSIKQRFYYNLKMADNDFRPIVIL